MMGPSWFLVGFALVLGLMIARRLRFFRSVWRKTREHPETLDDDWDPFA